MKSFYVNLLACCAGGALAALVALGVLVASSSMTHESAAA